jgi:hypothetical protein
LDECEPTNHDNQHQGDTLLSHPGSLNLNHDHFRRFLTGRHPSPLFPSSPALGAVLSRRPRFRPAGGWGRGVNVTKRPKTLAGARPYARPARAGSDVSDHASWPYASW